MPTFDNLTVTDPSFLRGAVSGSYVTQPLIPSYISNFGFPIPYVGIWSNSDFAFTIGLTLFGVYQVYTDAINIPYFWTELSNISDKTTMTSVSVHVVSTNAILPTIKPKIELWKRTGTIVTQVGLTITDPSVTGAAFAIEHDITLPGLTEVIDNSTWSKYFLKVFGMDNSTSGNLFILGISASISP